MSLDALRERLPAYAKDISLNLSSLAAETLLSDQQKWGAFVASAHAVGQPDVIRAVEAAAIDAGLSVEALTAAKAAAAIMGMNNVYYRSLHLLSNGEYKTLPARLRMNVLANPGVDKADFELWSTAVSA
ncbi:MAG TPA: alkyl hydroperoxide reductase, partial [Phenylobacterium sp.]